MDRTATCLFNSESELDDLLPVAIEMTLRGLTGNYNFTNPGTLYHNDILSLYRYYIAPNFTWVNFSIDEQDMCLKAPRSNNEIDDTNLLNEFPEIQHIER